MKSASPAGATFIAKRNEGKISVSFVGAIRAWRFDGGEIKLQIAQLANDRKFKIKLK
jgi:hypothetical protein